MAAMAFAPGGAELPGIAQLLLLTLQSRVAASE